MVKNKTPVHRHVPSRRAADDKSAAGDHRFNRVVVVQLCSPGARIGAIAPSPDERADLGGIAVLGYN